MQLQRLAMVPVRGTVYVVKLPLVCVWKVLFFLYSCLYAVFATILSYPVYYVKKAHNRLMLTWSWSKLFVRQSLGFSTNKTPAIADGTPTLHPRDYLAEPYTGPVVEDDPFGAYRRRGSRSGKRQRKAMITHLLRLLLEPTSPVESEDETERIPAARPAEQDEAEKALSLILDLVKLSKAETRTRDHSKGAPALKPEELEAILRRARDREHLQALITELDQLAIDVDPVRKAERVSSGHPSPSHAPCEPPERPSSTSSADLAYTPNNPSSVVSSSDEYMDPMDEEELEDVSERHPYNYGGLSPVQESPEYLTASSESIKMNQLEDELTKALSNLTTAASGLNADQEMVESMETQITQKTVTVTQSAMADNDLESVPKTVPQLGVQVGHDKRQLANARKPRPPSRRPQNTDSPNQQSDSARQNQGDLHSESSSDSDDDDDVIVKLEKGDPPETKPPIRGVRVLPPLELVDQIQLLTSGSKNWSTEGKVPEEDDDDDGDEPSVEPAESKVRKASLSRQDSASSETEKMKIPSNQPPWIEMVLRRKRSNSSTSSNPPTDAPVVVYEPPPRKTRADSDSKVPSHSEQKEDNIWDRDPSLDVNTGLYDTLQPKPAEPVYLHEKIAAAQQGAFPVEPSPQLPPRNNLALKRTASEETVTKPSSEKAVRRRGSERHSSRESRKDKESHSSSSSSSRSRDSSKDKPSRESRSRDKGTHESRSREKDRHHSSRHHSHSDERSERRHSSSSHRSRSGDRSSSHSTERRSSHHRSSSSKHRSSSRDKHSSTPKTPRETSSKVKLLSSPHSSRSKLSTSLFSRSSSKDKDDKHKEGEKRKSKSEDSKKKRSGSEKTSKSRRSSSEKEGSPGSGGMPRSASSTSIRSAGAASVYSFDSAISGKNTDV